MRSDHRCHTRHRVTLALALAVTSAAFAASAPAGGAAGSRQDAAPGPRLAPLLWLESIGGDGDAARASVEHARDAATPLPLLRELAPDDPRRAKAMELVDNEPARFARALVARAWASYGLPASWPEPRLPVLLQEGGNYARHGFQLQQDDGIAEHADVPYVVLALDARSLSGTFLHESGHLLHDIATGGQRPAPQWSPLPHTTFAVTDPLTAVAEGFGIQLETLHGHYASAPATRAFYHRLAPRFDARGTATAEFFAPAADLMTFSQTWARYLGVRDAWAAFAAHDYDGDYLRAQLDPSRDRAVLRPANAMLASEGVAASVLFWTAAGLAEAAGARPGEGLLQPGVIDAQEALLRALASASAAAREPFRPDIVDVIAGIGAAGSAERRLAIVRFVEITRGVTARPAFRADWRELYASALALDMGAIGQSFPALERERVALHDAAVKDPAVLRAGLGPVLPVRAPGVLLTLKALGDPFALEFDLNASTRAEWRALPTVEERVMARILTERDTRPFMTVADFEARTGQTLRALGLEPIKVP
jgi:hypothetical protein